jgi:hypothetical protein
MATLPVICENCGRLFGAPNLIGVAGGGQATVQLTDVRYGPCPHCGGVGRIPDGLYEIAEDAVRQLSGVPREQLLRLQALLARAQEHGATPEGLAREIEAEAPAAGAIASMLADGGSSLAAWLAVLLAVLQILLGQLHEPQPAQTPEQVAEIVRQVLDQTGRAAPQAMAPVAPAAPKVGRNQACPCGSGKKYKHCHGA